MLSNSVGKNGINAPNEVKFVQILLNKHASKKTQHAKLLSEDGKCGPKTVDAIFQFQSTEVKLAHPDGRIDPDKSTYLKLAQVGSKEEVLSIWNKVALTGHSSSDQARQRAGETEQSTRAGSAVRHSLRDWFSMPNFSGSQLCFPLPMHPCAPFNTDNRYFGAPREDDHRRYRAHAGCDLLAPLGTPIHALDDGEIKIFRSFYLGTYQLVVDHGKFLARYGEVKSQLPSELSVGSKVKKGQHIAYVGKMRGVRATMLHFELYTPNAIPGSLTNTTNGSPFQRCKHLLDPTNILIQSRNNLPV